MPLSFDRLPRLLATIGAAALVASACSTAPEGASRSDSPAPAVCTSLEELPGGDVANAPAADPVSFFAFEVPEPLVRDGFDPSQVISGGPPPDGIRPVDEPCFDDVVAADSWLVDQSPVLFIEVAGDARAYPLAILTQHEIVNDVIGGEPVVVTYCPLCNSGLAFERTVDGQVLDFGTSGRLFQSNLVMYDRQTRSLWTQFDGEAVMAAGIHGYVDVALERLPTSLVSFADFRTAHPDGLVLSPQSIEGRRYGTNPYENYDGRANAFLFLGPNDNRLEGPTRVVGLGEDDGALAVTLERLRTERVVDVAVGGEDLVVFWTPGQASALDTSVIDEGQDVGSTGVFVPRADGQDLTFEGDPADEGAFVDDQTGSTWNILGQAVAGPLAGAQLELVPHDDTYWFVWFAFRPETTVVE